MTVAISTLLPAAPEYYDDTQVDTQCRLCGKPYTIDKTCVDLYGHTSVCDKCYGEHDAKMRWKAIRQWWEEFCPAEYLETDLKHPAFPVEPWATMKRELGSSMILLGGSGRGKTRCMMLYLKHMVARGMSVSVVWPEEMKEEAGKQSRLQWIKAQCKYDVLGLDDLFMVGAAYEKGASLVKDLLDARIRARKQTIITSQIRASEFRGDARKFRSFTEAEGHRIEAIIRRIADKFKPIDFGSANGNGNNGQEPSF